MKRISSDYLIKMPGVGILRLNSAESASTYLSLLSHKRTSDPGLNVYMGGMAIAKSETLDVLGTSIRSDIRWNDHVFNVSIEAV